MSIITPQWAGNPDDRFWLARQTARLFDKQDLEQLRQMLQKGYDTECVAHPALSDLCSRLDEETLLSMLEEPIPEIQEYAVYGLAILSG